MLVSFEGKGCAECPFYREDDHYEAGFLGHECWLNGHSEDGIELKITLPEEEGAPTEWPKGCPFGEHIGTLQLTALEGTC